MVLAVAFIAPALGASAQKLKEKQVPASVKNAFAKQYPGTGVQWEKEAGNYEAGFKRDGKHYSVLYKPDGSMKEIETEIAIKSLPVEIVSYIKEHFKGMRIKEAAKITKADGTVSYEAEVNGNDLLFSENGTFLREVKD